MPSAAVSQPQLLLSKPGIQRDGTRFSTTAYLAGEWTRFYQNTPRKILGMREQRRDVAGIVRQIDVQSYDQYSYVHVGTQNQLQRYTINLSPAHLTSGLIDRTPVGFVTDPDNNWQFSLVFDTANNANLLLAHAAPNIGSIADTRERLVYFSEVRDPAALLPITGSEVSGGIVAMWPYFLRFGNDGEVAWPVPGDITDLVGTGSGSARPWGSKIVRGLPLRGQSGPAALLWALNALIRVQFVGGTRIFDFDTITTSSAILSSNCVIEHNGTYYWATVSGFKVFNGVIRDLDNEYNRQFFLDNLNWNFRQKAFVFKIPRWNEIWWCFPTTNSSECNWAVVWNYQRNFWFDTPLPASCEGFSAGIYEQLFDFPILCSPKVNDDTSGRSTWQFDFGLNEVSGAEPSAKAIRARIRGHEFTQLTSRVPDQLGKDASMSYSVIEPDFGQRGALKVRLFMRNNARSAFKVSEPAIVPAVPNGNEQTVKLKNTGRLTSFEIESNEVDGYFELGSPLVHWQPGDSRTEDGGSEPTIADEEDAISPAARERRP